MPHNESDVFKKIDIDLDRMKRDFAHLGADIAQFQDKGGGYRPKCQVEHKDAISAIERASTAQCKQELADVACKDQTGTFYPKGPVPNSCPLRSKYGDHFIV